jgi:RNA-directed DNA polymerase
MDSRTTRQQIYDKISASSKEEYILEEMKRLGFWNKNEDEPQLPELLIKKEGELQRDLNKLLAEKKRYEDKEQVLRDMRLKRMEAAKEKRKQTKERKEKEQVEKAAQWAVTKNTDIIFLGQDVSGGLQQVETDIVQLNKFGLPAFNDVETLAGAMSITISELKFLSYHRKVATTSHYKRFLIAKKSGGHRVISAPMPRLKKVQHWILQNILNKVTLHDAANGFVLNRSILTNASQHIDKAVVVNVDLKDFFPTITYKRVKGLFSKLGYSEKIATILALLCTEPTREEMELDGKNYFVASGDRFLPQGAPTSPAITNIICYKLDCRFKTIATKMNINYTRYADDLSFSINDNPGNSNKLIQRLLWQVKTVVKEEGFTIHPDKVKIMAKGTRQEVTGIVVNKKPGINGKTLHRFRALIQQIEKTGLADKKWKGGDNIVAEMLGYANFIMQVKPEQGIKLKQKLQTVFNLPFVQEAIRQLPQPNNFAPSKSTNDKNNEDPATPDNKDWWNVL